jgi:hypothetical protein
MGRPVGARFEGSLATELLYPRDQQGQTPMVRQPSIQQVSTLFRKINSPASNRRGLGIFLTRSTTEKNEHAASYLWGRSTTQRYRKG